MSLSPIPVSGQETYKWTLRNHSWLGDTVRKARSTVYQVREAESEILIGDMG